MSTEAHFYMQHHQSPKCKHFNVSDVIYHKFSHGAAFYILDGENINVMLEFIIFLAQNFWCDLSSDPNFHQGSSNKGLTEIIS